MDNNIVLTETEDSVTSVTLNRPDSLNALSIDLRRRLAEVFKELKEDDNTRVIILTGAGRAFTAGLDLKELGQKGMNTPGSNPDRVDLQKAIREVGKPVIAAVNGVAITGGFELWSAVPHNRGWLELVPGAWADHLRERADR